jgi:hypothetical protein
LEHASYYFFSEASNGAQFVDLMIRGDQALNVSGVHGSGFYRYVSTRRRHVLCDFYSPAQHGVFTFESFARGCFAIEHGVPRHFSLVASAARGFNVHDQ